MHIYAQVICKHYDILYKGFENLKILVSLEASTNFPWIWTAISSAQKLRETQTEDRSSCVLLGYLWTRVVSHFPHVVADDLL